MKLATSARHRAERLGIRKSTTPNLDLAAQGDLTRLDLLAKVNRGLPAEEVERQLHHRLEAQRWREFYRKSRNTTDSFESVVFPARKRPIPPAVHELAKAIATAAVEQLAKRPAARA